MSPVVERKVIEIVIVAAGLLLTLLLGGALFYWIDQQWRTLDARHRRERGSAPPPGCRDEARESSGDEPPVN